MDRVKISDIFSSPESFDGRTVTVCGWVRSLRASKDFAFLMLHDGSCFACIQAVLERGSLADYDSAVRLNIGSAVVLGGTVRLTPEREQAFEVSVDSLTVEGAAPPDYPLQKKRHSPEFLREIAHLRPRTNIFQAVFRVRSEAAFAVHSFFHERGFVYVNTPLITASDCEGAGEMFRVTTLDISSPPKTEDDKIDWKRDFFSRATNLTVSGQLEGETFAEAFGSIYTFGPTFRAENSNTPRHAAEFWMIEPEIAFADLGDEMRLSWELITAIIRHVLASCPDEMSFFDKFIEKGLIARLEKLLSSEPAELTYTQAVDILQKSGESFKYPVSWGCDLQTEHERYLTEKVYSSPVFVTDYPKEIKSFYMRLNDDGRTVAACDLLFPGVGEIVGGSQREERLDVLLSRMAECALDSDSYKWYTDLRRYGSTRHAGFGLGFERILMYITGVSNIRDVIPYPRVAGSAEF